MDIQYKNQKQTAKMDFGRRRIDHASLKETLVRMKTDYQSDYHLLFYQYYSINIVIEFYHILY